MRFGWRSALGIALSALLLAWTLRSVDLEVVAQQLRQSNIALLLLAAFVGTLTFPLRARRWQTILEPIAEGIPFGMLWRATAIGMMVSNVVPARAGELARAYALSRETDRVPFSAAFASVVADRVFDAFVVLSLMLLAMFDPAFPGEQLVLGKPVANWVGTGTLVAAAAMLMLYAVVFLPERLILIFELLVRRVSPRLERRGRDALIAFASGLGVLRSPGRFVSVLVWTIAHWLVSALAFWIGFVAVGIEAPFSAALMVQGLIAIGVAIPSSPGFFGVFEALATASLPLYGVPREQAVTWAIGYHLLSYIPITLIGGYYFARLGLHFRELRPGRSDSGTDVPANPLSVSGGDAAR